MTLTEDKIITGDSTVELKNISSETVDCIVTDPPYGLNFMGKNWDKAVPSVEIWKDCLRVLKDGAFAFIMSSPRLDVLGEMSRRLQSAGFETGFTPIFWVYASGFPKSINISKAVDKKLGFQRPKREAEGEFHGTVYNLGCENKDRCSICGKQFFSGSPCQCPKVDKIPLSIQSKTLDGSYAGFQPKPAVEVIIVAMKPLSEKTYVEQALKNRKGVTWLDDGRIPFANSGDATVAALLGKSYEGTIHSEMTDKYGLASWKAKRTEYDNTKGRFPADLLVSDNMLDDGFDRGTKPHAVYSSVAGYEGWGSITKKQGDIAGYGDSGTFSRYFSLDAWWVERIKTLPESVQKNFPFLIVPKASKNERNEGLNSRELSNTGLGKGRNIHVTVKPLQLMSYLVSIGSRQGDTILDPFLGSGTTAIACKLLGRRYIGIEVNVEYASIAVSRVEAKPYNAVDVFT